ncbi:MAG: hypothetical protein ACK58T_28530, partial [Phycisphaerae bacterium]
NSAITGMGKIVNDIGDIPTQRVVDLTGLRWGKAAVQSGVTDTRIIQNQQGVREEFVFFEMVNKNEEPIRIKRGDPEDQDGFITSKEGRKRGRRQES